MSPRALTALTSSLGATLLLTLTLTLTLDPPLGFAESGRRHIAVLDFKNSAQLNTFEVTSLTSIVRGSASRLGGFKVMTKENVTELLPPGTRLEDCVGTCEVETGRLLGAAFIVTGEVGRVEGKIQLSLRLFNTAKGNLLAQEVLISDSVLGLQQKLAGASMSLFSKLSADMISSDVSLGSTVFLTVSPPGVSLELNDSPLSLDQFKKKGAGHLLRLKPGTYTLRGSASGYLDQEERFVLTQGSVYEVRLQLNKALKRDTSCDPADKSCRGEVQVFTQPPGATLWVDGKKTAYLSKPSRRDPTLGNVTLTLPPGEHVIEARLPQHLPAQARIVLKKDDLNQELKERPLKMTPNFGQLSIESQPTGATVFIDNKMVGQTPWSEDRIVAGPHKVRLFLAEYQTHNEIMVVDRGRSLKERVTLTPTFSTIEVVVREEGRPIPEASVMLDQRLIGRTDREGARSLGRVPEGQRQLQITHPLYEPWVKPMTAEAGQNEVIEVELKPAYGLLSVSVKGQISADVSWDGEPLGAAPIVKKRVASGNGRLVVTPYDQQKYKVFERRVGLGPKDHQEVTATCTSRQGRVTILTDPSEADLIIDGVNRGTSPLKLDLFQGEHTLIARYPDYAESERTLKVVEGESQRVRVELSADPSVKVTCDPSGAVYLDGQQVGPSPQVITRKPGGYEVACQLNGLWERKRVTLSGRQEEVRLRILPSRLKALASERSSKRTRALITGISALALTGSSLYFGLVSLPDDLDARDAALGALDADRAWALDEDAQASSDLSLYFGVGAGVLALWSAYDLFTAPAPVRYKTDAGVTSRSPRPSRSWTPVFSLSGGVGVGGVW